MKILDVIYYRFYSFYKKWESNLDAHLSARLALSFGEIMLIFTPINLLLIKFYRYRINRLTYVLIGGAIVYINYIYFEKKSNGKRIEKQKPNIADNVIISKVVALLFFVVSVSLLFVGTFYGKDLWIKVNNIP